MLIDWFTVGAQALNFLILVWLLKRFLYKPILDAIDAREKRIAKELADADAKKAEAQKEREEFQHKNEEFDQQRAGLLSKATDQATAERQRLLEEARKAADALSAKREASLRNDALDLSQAITRRTQQEVFAIARKALTDLATTSLEERIGEVFTRRLRTMDGHAKASLGEALKTASEPAVVRSVFDLPAEQRAAIQNALNETFSAEIHVRFETAPDLVGGIELAANGQKVAWNISDYLASLQSSVGELLKEKTKTEPKTKPRPEAKTEPKSEVKAAIDFETKPEAKEGLKPVAKAEPEPEAQAKSKPAPEVEAEPRADDKAESEARARLKPGAEPKTEPKDEAKLEPKTEEHEPVPMAQ
jgi:F-type H+-transporting ATPase subunit b